MPLNNAMVEDLKRPDPDALLAHLKSEEEQQNRGQLKVFLGYVAGVGKTYAMLEAAHQRKEEGIDVVVAYVETHGRKETEALLKGLEIVPRRNVEYHSATLTDMDLDAVLARHPQLALVDELAHSNAPGLRHPKRFQDVEELLSAGINVYTTINIQHLESLNDVVQQITGVAVRETVPDSLIDEACEIELVDLPPDELLQRLRSGKVYVPDQAVRALEKFFRKGNLTALRELSLRQAADRVDSQMVDYMHARAISGPWPAGDRIMVCISSHPLGERLIRTGRRLADDLNAEWYVVFVETPGHLDMPEENRQRIQQNLQLASRLGARVVNLQGSPVAEIVLDFAHEHNITKIVAGKPLRSRWHELVRGSVIDHIIRNSGKIDVYVVSGEAETLQKIRQPGLWFHYPSRKYFESIFLILLTTLLGLPLRGILDPTNLVMIFLVAVVISAIFLGRGPAILASFLSVVVFDFFFVDPRLSFAVSDTQYLITFSGLLVVGLVISNSAAILRNQLKVLRNRNHQVQALYELSRDLNSAFGKDQVIEVVLRNIKDLFSRDVVILLPSLDHKLVKQAPSTDFELDENELAVAEWAYKNGRAAGHGTDTLPATPVYFLPLRTVQGVIGILGVKPIDPQKTLTLDQRSMMEGFSNMGALAIERAIFAEQAADSEMLRRTEKLQTALLNSISHELRTPLATITGVLTSLKDSESSEPANMLDQPTRIELIDSGIDQARQLNRLVENLLDMTRLESGGLLLHREPVDFKDLTGSILHQLADRLHDHPIRIQIPDDLPLVSMDAILVGQVLANLLDNGCKYSSKGSPIIISARISDHNEPNQTQKPREINTISMTPKPYLIVNIRDYGYGIPEQDLERVFDKFYRSQRQGQVVGTGLGLSICKGIIEAHDGRIFARENIDQGVTFTFLLPNF
jgi:two-component system, OmpR family, sensor histidine kinase KdpD